LKHTDKQGGTANGSLRSVWCFWIDEVLAQIDANADQWSSNVERNLLSKFHDKSQLLARAKAFIAQQITSNNGLLNSRKMKIPTQPGTTTQSKYSAWGGNGYPAPVKGEQQ
jgi:hypothetical protein